MMRAVVFGLIGAVLAVCGARAGECRPGHMAFVGDGKAFEVAEVSQTQARVAGRGAERSIYRGALNGKPAILDIQGVEGSSTNFISYSGRTPQKTEMVPNWGKTPDWLADGFALTVYSGPLRGDLRLTCK